MLKNTIESNATNVVTAASNHCNCQSGQLHRLKRILVYCRMWEVCVGVILALIMVNTSFTLIGNPFHLLSTIYEYQFVGQWTGMWIAIVLPYAILSLSIALALRIMVDGALLLSWFLLTTYSVAQYSVLWRGSPVHHGSLMTNIGGFITVDSATQILLLSVLALSAYACRLFIVDDAPDTSLSPENSRSG